MTPVEALKIALSQEEAAINMYQKMALDHPAIKEILLLLLNEEEKHKMLINKKISEITRI